MNLNGPMCLNNKDTLIRAALFSADSRLPAEINSPNGKVKFIQLVGITEDEYELTWEWSSSGLIDVRIFQSAKDFELSFVPILTPSHLLSF